MSEKGTVSINILCSSTFNFGCRSSFNEPMTRTADPLQTRNLKTSNIENFYLPLLFLGITLNSSSVEERKHMRVV